jgi:hypothetical protein
MGRLCRMTMENERIPERLSLLSAGTFANRTASASLRLQERFRQESSTEVQKPTFQPHAALIEALTVSASPSEISPLKNNRLAPPLSQRSSMSPLERSMG